MSSKFHLILFISIIVSTNLIISCTKTPQPIPEVQIQKGEDYGIFTFYSVGENTNASAWSYSIVGQVLSESDEQEVASESLVKVQNRSFFGNEVSFQFYENDTAKGLLFVSREDQLDSMSFDIEVNDVPTLIKIEKIKISPADFDTSQVTLKIVQAEYDEDYHGLPEEPIELFFYEKDVVIQDTLLLDSAWIKMQDFAYRHVYFEGLKNMTIQFYKGSELLFEIPFDIKAILPTLAVFDDYDGVVRTWYPNEKTVSRGSKSVELFLNYQR